MVERLQRGTIERRRGYRPPDCEFTVETKFDAWQRCGGRCESCHKEKDPDEFFQVHHKLGVMYAVRHYPRMAHSLIASLANAVVLCEPCHRIRDKTDRELQEFYADQLTGQFKKNYISTSKNRL